MIFASEVYILLVTDIHAYSEIAYVLPNLSSRNVSRVTVHSIDSGGCLAK